MRDHTLAESATLIGAKTTNRWCFPGFHSRETKSMKAPVVAMMAAELKGSGSTCSPVSPLKLMMPGFAYACFTQSEPLVFSSAAKKKKKIDKVLKPTRRQSTEHLRGFWYQRIISEASKVRGGHWWFFATDLADDTGV
jgi:hypothetical protein